MIIFAVFVAACSSPSATTLAAGVAGETTSAATAPDPSVVLLQFLNSLRDGDFVAAGDLTDEPQLLLLAAIEAADASLLGGIPDGAATLDPQIRENFWSSFVTAVPGLSGTESFSFSEPEEYLAAADEFQAIMVTLGDGTTIGTWVLRNDPSDGWLIDPIASLGGPFVGSYSDWTSSLTAGQRLLAQQAAGYYRSSWQVLADRQPGDDPGVAVAQSVDDLLRLIDEPG